MLSDRLLRFRETIWARLAGASCILVVAVLSLIPAAIQRRTPLPGAVEHFLAYAITGAVVVFALPEVRVTVIVLCLAILAGLMEILQLMVPGRESDIRDFIASSAGAAAGALAMISAIRTASRRRG